MCEEKDQINVQDIKISAWFSNGERRPNMHVAFSKQGITMMLNENRADWD